MARDRQGLPINKGDDVYGGEIIGVAPDPGPLSETDDGAVATPDRPTGRFAADVDPSMAEDVLRVPVYEEELTTTKTVRDVAGARFEKIVVVEEPGLDLTSTEERLKVVRRTVNRPADGANAEVFEEVIVDVPLNLAALDLENGVQVGEEIAIWKEAVQRTEHVTGTVRREDVTITELTAGALVDDQERRP